jgi:hypothetical protein
MCLNCGCMRAHDDMGKPDVNITYERVKRMADANGLTVEETIANIARTAAKDREDHPHEYQGKAA